MSAEPVQAGLSRAQRAIASTYDELCRTLESVRELTDEGVPQDALRLVDLQRDALDRLVDQVAREIAVVPVRRKPGRIRSAAAAALAVAAAAIGLLVVGNANNGQDLERELSRAERIADPADRLDAITKIYGASLARPADVTDALRPRIVAAAKQIAEDGEDRDAGNRQLRDRASRLASSAESGEPAPPSPPSEGDDPIDTIRGNIRRP